MNQNIFRWFLELLLREIDEIKTQVLELIRNVLLYFPQDRVISLLENNPKVASKLNFKIIDILFHVLRSSRTVETIKWGLRLLQMLLSIGNIYKAKHPEK